MSGPPPTAPPSPPTSASPPSPPYYGPPYFPYPYPPLPPKRDNVALIIVIVVVLVSVVPVVIGAILYVMVAGLIRSPDLGPPVFLGPAELTAGNVTLRVFTSGGELDPSGLRLALQANGSAPAEFGIPPPDGSVSVSTGGHALRVFWLDEDHDSLLGTGDSFWFTGNLAPLPRATAFTFAIQSPTGHFSAETTWTT